MRRSPADPPTPARRRPVLDPDLSLGWRDGPLDGLSCLLRCVESAIRAEGFDKTAVARALAVPLDLRGDRRESARWRYGRLDWRNAVDGHEHWAEFVALLDAGSPCVLMPDRYYWPGDEFAGRRHFLDHMVLALGCTDGRLEVLDTDAPPDDEYIRRIPVTPDLVRGACRYATVHFRLPDDTPASLRGTLLEPMARWLWEDLPAVAGFARRWAAEGITGPTARALHVLVLGELQPTLFLAAEASQEWLPGIAAQCREASRAAQGLGKALLGAHRFGGADASDASVYEPVQRPYATMLGALTGLCAGLHEELGIATAPGPGAGADELWERVARTRDWCFADAVAAPSPANLPTEELR